MHEMSIAQAILDLVERYVAVGESVCAVRITAGPLRGIEPQAMQWAWEAATPETRCANARLELNLIPWRLHCRSCRRHWSADDALEACTCGSRDVRPEGSDDLLLDSIEVPDGDDITAPVAATATAEVHS